MRVIAEHSKRNIDMRGSLISRNPITHNLARMSNHKFKTRAREALKRQRREKRQLRQRSKKRRFSAVVHMVEGADS
jgi:hypothetical protein